MLLTLFKKKIDEEEAEGSAADLIEELERAADLARSEVHRAHRAVAERAVRHHVHESERVHQRRAQLSKFHIGR